MGFVRNKIHNLRKSINLAPKSMTMDLKSDRLIENKQANDNLLEVRQINEKIKAK